MLQSYSCSVSTGAAGLVELDAAKSWNWRKLTSSPANVWSCLNLEAVRMLDDRDFPDPVVGNADAGGGVWSPRSSCATFPADG